MPPWRKYSTSAGASILTVVSNWTQEPSCRVTLTRAFCRGVMPAAMPAMSIGLFAGQAEGLRRCAGIELQGQDAHADEVAAVDALVALGDDRLDAQQRGPLAAQSRELPEPYSLPAITTSGIAFMLVLHRGVEDAHLLAARVGGGSTAPSTPGTIWFRNRMLAKVPRIITS